MHLSKKKTVIAILVSLAALGAVFGVAWGLSYVADSFRQSSKIAEVPETENSEKIKLPSFKSIAEKTRLKTEDGKTNMLLLGISGEDYISGDLADTVMLLSLEYETEKAYLFSLPRDLWISHNGEFQKINELYRVAGGTEEPDAQKTGLMKDKVQEVTGQNIHYSMVINLDGIKDIVDLVGGVETDEGHKNGEEALLYVRDRSRPGGDFDRMARQQKLIVAILQKITDEDTAYSGEKDELIETYQEYFSTDISILQFLQLEPAFNKLSTENIEMYTITPSLNNLLYSNMTDVNGQQIYTLHPTAGYEDYTEVQEFINSKLQN